VIQVVPQLKPSRCGVSDHAISLALELRRAYGLNSSIVILNESDKPEIPIPYVNCTPETLEEACHSFVNHSAPSLLVHYSGYGYSQDGAPLAFAQALARLKTSGEFRFGVYFHELYASGMPWTKAFWFSRRQKHVVRMIAQHCDLIVTNLGFHKAWLERNTLNAPPAALRQLPVFSNIGETDEIPSISGREPALVVFGLPGTRRRSYERLRQMSDLLRALGIERIIDIGPEFDVPSAICGVPIGRKGILEKEEIFDILSSSRFGFVSHPSICLAKSGSLAAFAALGVIPVVASTFPAEMDGLTDGVHLISPHSVTAVRQKDLDRISTAIWSWYSLHNLRVHARTYAELLEPAQAAI